MLPEGWKTDILEPTAGIKLKPGEQRPFTIVIQMVSRGIFRIRKTSNITASGGGL
jgi:hypothetical protein